MRRLSGWAEFYGSLHVVPGRGVVPTDEYFCLVRVEFATVALHPLSDVHHGSVEVGSGDGGVFGQREDELGVVGIGEDFESMRSDCVRQGGSGRC